MLARSSDHLVVGVVDPEACIAAHLLLSRKHDADTDTDSSSSTFAVIHSGFEETTSRSPRQYQQQQQQLELISCVSFPPDNDDRFISAETVVGGQAQVGLYELATGGSPRLLHPYGGPRAIPTDMAFCAAQVFVASSSDGSVHLYDLRSPTPTTLLSPTRQAIPPSYTSIDASPTHQPPSYISATLEGHLSHVDLRHHRSPLISQQTCGVPVLRLRANWAEKGVAVCTDGGGMMAWDLLRNEVAAVRRASDWDDVRYGCCVWVGREVWAASTALHCYGVVVEEQEVADEDEGDQGQQ
ncbi:unnamed protein product [Vitrella brassicaformis CCMP3155]|uniref:Uncharacterized protein n=1 Tax=Vitrella brassicaformis (strain CCMP3155) TaxID=1169540 RepID=A0A0G4H642_VITBC|nr:unnamed protein product [Vitrella brassicaformis CCMP3155]|eukprot:CEM39327.1 unnamed protein product [Vitrella brassicaformis CCMP3155]